MIAALHAKGLVKDTRRRTVKAKNVYVILAGSYDFEPVEALRAAGAGTRAYGESTSLMLRFAQNFLASRGGMSQVAYAKIAMSARAIRTRTSRHEMLILQPVVSRGGRH